MLRSPDRLAALMGDLVSSEEHETAADLHALFNAAIDRQNLLREDVLASPLTITLGDEFQGLARSLVAAFDIVRDVRLGLLADDIECRFAIGTVDLETPINRDRAWNMMGPGLADTRRRLNDKRPATLYGFALPAHPVLETMLEASGTSLTAIERGWTATQRGDIAALLAGQTPADVARRRGVSVHTVYKVRGSGSFDLYLTHLDAIRVALVELDRLRAGDREEG